MFTGNGCSITCPSGYRVNSRGICSPGTADRTRSCMCTPPSISLLNRHENHFDWGSNLNLPFWCSSSFVTLFIASEKEGPNSFPTHTRCCRNSVWNEETSSSYSPTHHHLIRLSFQPSGARGRMSGCLSGRSGVCGERPVHRRVLVPGEYCKLPEYRGLT